MSTRLAAAIPVPRSERPPRAAEAGRRLRVMQVTDWLEPGGKERVALNIGNLLPVDRYRSYLCTTRADGPLESLVEQSVERLRLRRRHVLHINPVRRLIAFNLEHGIDVLHAHGSSLFMAAAASMFPPYPAVVWHDHFGPYRTDDRPTWLYRLAASRVSAVIAVNRPLADWARVKLRVPADRVWYIPNFVCEPSCTRRVLLPGTPGYRVVCVAHLRPQKDHATLVNAFARVAAAVPAAHLLIIGAGGADGYAGDIRRLVSSRGLSDRITLMGQRDDVDSILRLCDVGVLSSRSEGFPLALVEYGQAGLPTVATAVGECPEVLDHGAAGILVPPGDVDRLADELIRVLTRTESRELGAALRTRVRAKYHSSVVMEQVCRVYTAVAFQSRVAGRGEQWLNGE